MNTFYHRVNQPIMCDYIEFLRFLRRKGQVVPEWPERDSINGIHVEKIKYTGESFRVDRDF